MSFQEILLSCAEKWGKADQTGTLPAIPSDPADLDQCKRRINEGYRSFLSSNPRWSFAEEKVQVLLAPDGSGPFNIESDGGRYRLPKFIGSIPLTDWTYVGQSTPGGRILTVDHDLVVRQQSQSDATGNSTHAGVGPIVTGEGPGGQHKGWEVRFWPRPQGAYTVEATFRVTSHKLVDLEDRHIAGREHDETILAFCDAEWYKHDAEDPEIAQRYMAIRTDALERSIELDKQMSPRRHGKVVDPSTQRVSVNRYTNLGRITMDGVPI